MSKKTFIAAITISLVSVSLVAGIQVLKMAEANPFFYCFWTITSPRNGANPTQPVQLNFTAILSFELVSPASFYYVTDGQDNQQGTNVTNTKFTGMQNSDYMYNGQAQLNTLSNGPHNITVYWGRYTEGKIYVPDIIGFNATVTFNIGNITIAPSKSPTPTPLIIDLTNGNYINDVIVDQPVYFSADIGNGAPPYRFHWYYRQYYVGSAIGDVYPVGETMLGSDSQNFTFTANSTGHYLISVEVWDSAGAEGYFMSIPNPGIWVNAAAPTPTPMPTINPTPSPSTTPSLTPTPSPPTTPSSSPTQQPKLEHSPTPDSIQVENYAPMIILAGLMAIAASASLIVYLKRRR